MKLRMRGCLIHCAKIHMEFTGRGGLPKTGCLLRAKIGFAMAGGGFNVQKQNDEMLTGTSKYR